MLNQYQMESISEQSRAFVGCVKVRERCEMIFFVVVEIKIEMR